jgi:hypothetical protein
MEAIIGVVVGDSLLSRGGAEATPSESRAATVLGTALADYCGWR